MPLLGTSPREYSRLVKFEFENLWSRETAPVKAGVTIRLFQPVMLVAGELAPCLTVNDLANAVGFAVIGNTLTTITDADGTAVYLARHCRINLAEVEFPAAAVAADKTAFVALMDSKYILVR